MVMRSKVRCDTCKKDCSGWYAIYNITAIPSIINGKKLEDSLPIQDFIYHHVICQECYNELTEHMQTISRRSSRG